MGKRENYPNNLCSTRRALARSARVRALEDRARRVGSRVDTASGLFPLPRAHSRVAGYAGPSPLLLRSEDPGSNLELPASGSRTMAGSCLRLLPELPSRNGSPGHGLRIVGRSGRLQLEKRSVWTLPTPTEVLERTLEGSGDPRSGHLRSGRQRPGRSLVASLGRLASLELLLVISGDVKQIRLRSEGDPLRRFRWFPE